ncbi:MAG: DsbA family protein [Nitrospinae bacterium]|nr:DsbA family protein [Nitrospinota bacterium]
MKYVLTVLLSLAVLLPGTAWSAAEKIKGKYEVVGAIDSLKGAKEIEMLEFFNYSCGHCYRFLETSKKLHAKYKDKLLHKKYPIYWGNQTPYPSMAFYISDELGMEGKFTQDLFDTNFKLNINIFKPQVIQILAKDFGIEKEMTAGMQSDKIKARVDKAIELGKQYNASETPTIIINKTLKVVPSKFDGNVDAMTDNLDVIFHDILNFK